MKISNLSPMIMSPNAEELISLFEELGFEKHHTKTGLNDENITHVRMKNADSFPVDISYVDRLPQDVACIRMNVDNFEEAYDFLIKKGFKNTQGDKIGESKSGKGTAMMSPTGFIIVLSHHIKNHD